MYAQVVFRYPGQKWHTFGQVGIVAVFDGTYRACRKAHPNAQLGVIEGFTLEDLRAKLQVLLANGQVVLEESEGPQGVPPSEDGPGGDADTPYTGPVLPDSWPVVSTWLTLMGKFRRGELGGANDGATRLPAPQQEKDGAA